MKIAILEDFKEFRDISLKGSKKASEREVRTNHIQEFLKEESKATFYITNYLGGEYYLTADEIIYEDNIYIIQESKNSSSNSLPSLNDIQDGLFKLILYSNLDSLSLEDKNVDFSTRLKLTGANIVGKLIMPCTVDILNSFINRNNENFNQREIEIIKKLNKESSQNSKLSIEIESH